MVKIYARRRRRGRLSTDSLNILRPGPVTFSEKQADLRKHVVARVVLSDLFTDCPFSFRTLSHPVRACIGAIVLDLLYVTRGGAKGSGCGLVWHQSHAGILLDLLAFKRL